MATTPVHGAQVVASDPADTLHAISIPVERDGAYMLALYEARDYVIRYQAPDYASKTVQVQMQGPSTAQWAKGYGLSVDMSLYKITDGLDLTYGGRPVGKAVFNFEKDFFEWDGAYSKALRVQQKDMVKAYRKHHSGSAR